MFVFSRPHLLGWTLWLVSYPSIVILIYFNIKAFGRLNNDVVRSKIRINLYITFFYLIVYIPVSSVFQIGNIYWILIEGVGGLFFFISAYSFLLRKNSTALDDARMTKWENKKEAAIMMNFWTMPSGMSNIIKVFKNEHKIILDRILLIKKKDDFIKKHEEFLSLKTVLIGHLEKEKEHLYLPLLETERVDEKLNKILKIFITNIEKTTELVESFYNRFEPLGNRKGFSDGLDKFLEELSVRIMSDEDLFFNEYEEYFNIKSDCTDPLKGKRIYRKFDRICIELVSLVGIIFFLVLTGEIFYIKPMSYASRHNFSSPDNYYTLVVLAALVILFYFLTKGFYKRWKYNLPKRLFHFIILRDCKIIN